MTEKQQQGVFKPAVNLTFAIAIGWVVCFWPARVMNGEAGVWWMSIAAICCLVPGWIVVFLGTLDIFSNDLSTMLVQTSVRLAVVGGVAVLVKKQRPDLGVADFFGWLIGFYLLALAIEVWMLRQRRGGVSSQGSGQVGS